MPKSYAMGLCAVLCACLCAGCAGSNAAPPRSLETSYPSPDYPARTSETAAPAPAAAQTTPPATAAPQGRPLYGPVGQAAPAGAPAAAPAAPATAVSAPQGAVPPMPGRRLGGGPGAPNMGRLFEAMDTDHNGRVTLEEWRNFQEREFRRLDKNDDGVLTREEMTAPPPMAPGGPAGRRTP